MFFLFCLSHIRLLLKIEQFDVALKQAHAIVALLQRQSATNQKTLSKQFGNNLTLIGKILAKKAKHDEAVVYFLEAIEKYRLNDNNTIDGRVRTSIQLAKSIAALGRIDEALEIANKVYDDCL